MPILSTHFVPHPPLIVEAVGGGREKEIQATIDSYHKIAKKIASDNPETIIIISPHATYYSDYFHIAGGKEAFGSFAKFGSPQVFFRVDYDTEFVNLLEDTAKKHGIAAGTLGEKNSDLDHGTLVPLYFIEQYTKNFKIVRISISGLSLEDHFQFGNLIKQISVDKRVVIVASGDLSHCLKEDGPYGYKPSGPKFDSEITEAMRFAKFEKFMAFEENFLSDAAECGLRSFVIASGALDATPIEAEFHSYEGTFGVGYALCSYYVINDLYVFLARYSLENYIKCGEYVSAPQGLPDEFFSRGRGVFVSIKKNGELRGCIGTISGIQENLAIEIIANAVSAGTSDPRFDPIEISELPELTFSVDVLMEAEEVTDISELDVKKYGVIVTCGLKRGLLLPNLDGVDDVATQLSIALNKGRISQNENYKIERFEVVRHKV